jgi:POT family proton-dependent oligopeptide transporter
MATAPTTTPADPSVEKSDLFPPGIPFIVGNEGAERFSFYGMRQILYVYMVALLVRFAAEDTVDPTVLADAKVRATQVTHVFMAAVYAVPMLGAILADRLLGKYRVIFWVSLIYVGGHGVLALAGRLGEMGSFEPAEALFYAGLMLIAVGSGGIKPCVSANVGDQFTAKNGHLVGRVFQIFYFIINFGSFFATLLTPWLYKNMGPEIAFGVPGILMALAALVFWAGRRRFVHVPAHPGGQLGLLDFIASALLFAPIAAIIIGYVMGGGHGDVKKDAPLSEHIASIFTSFWHILWPGFFIGLAFAAVGVIIFGIRQKKKEDTGFLSVLLYTVRHQKDRKPGEGFFDVARAHFGDEAAEGPPAVLRIMLVFSMVSLFWALFDQHSSTWVEQAKQMNLKMEVPLWLFQRFLVPAVIVMALFGFVWLMKWVSNNPLPPIATRIIVVVVVVWGLAMATAQFINGDMMSLELQPAQIASLNPLMVMIIIPALNVFVYKPMEKRGTPLRPLVRMTIGMFLAAGSFVAIGLLQTMIDGAEKNTVSVLWQVFPYLIITTSEVLVSVTGLEFAYTQAPRAMKSTIMGFWLLCVFFGNILVAFLAPLQALSFSTFFYVFAGLMGAAATLFMVMAYFYKGKSYLQQ